MNQIINEKLKIQLAKAFVPFCALGAGVFFGMALFSDLYIGCGIIGIIILYALFLKSVKILIDNKVI